MATGGFSANVDMRVKYNQQWEDIGESLTTNNSPGATGDGIVMGEAVGVNLVGMGWIQLMPLNGVSGGGISGYVNSSLFCTKKASASSRKTSGVTCWLRRLLPRLTSCSILYVT